MDLIWMHVKDPLEWKVETPLRHRRRDFDYITSIGLSFWQDTDYVLKLFGGHTTQARKLYRDFVQKEAQRGRRPELSGGGLVRSLGGWKAIQAMRSSGDRTLGDERILGDGDFVESALAAGSETLERRSRLKASGYDFERIAERVAVICDMPLSEVLREGKSARTVAARSLLCYWANRELGITRGACPQTEPGSADSQPVGRPRGGDRG